MYYLRTKSAADAIKFTLDSEAILKTTDNIKTELISES